MTTFFFTIIGLALVDAINPMILLTLLPLLATEQPKTRVAAYILGVFVANTIGGLLVLTGLGVLIGNLLGAIPSTWLYGALLLLGIILLIAGLKINVSSLKVYQPRSLRPVHTLLLGMFVASTEVSTGIPYLVALEQITEQSFPVGATVILVLIYNMLFCLPLLATLVLLLFRQDWLTEQLDAINVWSQRWLPQIIKPVLIVFGALFVFYGFRYLLESGWITG